MNNDADQYLCPSSGDDNQEGKLLVLGRTPPGACSYAGRRNRVQARYPGVFTDKNSSDTVLASDDDEGRPRFNHGDAVILLFLDTHVEEVPLRNPRLGGLGKGGLLDPLAN